MPPAIRAEHLTVRYGAVTALSEIDFELSAGRSVAILGPNGSGKSTLLAAALGLVEPAAGRLDLASGGVAFVPQGIETPREFPATVLDVVRMGRWPDLGWRRRFAVEDHERVLAAMDELGIEPIAATPFGELSGGQRQRTLLAQAIAQDAPTLLLDEPFTGVDRPTRNALMRLIADWSKEGRTVLVATHDLESAADYDLVLCLNRRQVAFGPPSGTLTEEVLRETFAGHLARVGETLIDTAHHHHGAG